MASPSYWEWLHAQGARIEGARARVADRLAPSGVTSSYPTPSKDLAPGRPARGWSSRAAADISATGVPVIVLAAGGLPLMVERLLVQGWSDIAQTNEVPRFDLAVDPVEVTGLNEELLLPISALPVQGRVYEGVRAAVATVSHTIIGATNYADPLDWYLEAGTMLEVRWPISLSADPYVWRWEIQWRELLP